MTLMVPLGSVATIDRSSIASEEIVSGTTYVGLENLKSDGSFEGVREVDAGDLASSKFRFSTEHVLYGKLRPYLRKIARPGFTGICSTDILPILPGAAVDRNYLTHFLRLDSSVDFANSRTTGANLPRISPMALEELMVPLPSIGEQRRIAAILDQAEVLRSKRRQALAKLDTLTQSLFLEMFGDPRTNRKGWRTAAFGNVGVLDRGVSQHRPRNAPELLGGTHPLVQTGEITRCNGYIRSFKNTYSDLGLKQSRLWPAGTLCITIAANIANTAILTFPACFPDSVVGFTPNSFITVEYVQTWMSFMQKLLEDSAPAFAQKNINLAILKTLVIPVPPIDLQRRFSHHREHLVDLRNCHCLAQVKEDTLFASLQHRAFHGEL